MRIDGDMQPLGPERMLQRLQEFQAQVGAAPVFNMGGGVSGLTGNLPGETGSLAPFDLKAAGVSVTADKAPPGLKALIDKAANENGIDPALLDSVVAIESSYNPTCKSRAGALGLTQLMPDNLKEFGVTNWQDPEQNLQGGARQLAKLIDKYPNRLDLALAAYNAGPGAVAKFGGIPPYTETQNYVKKVMDLYKTRSTLP